MTTRVTSGDLHGAVVRAGYAALPSADLLARYLDGRDEAAFRELVERYSGVVARACRAALGRDDLARDAFQETFLRLVRHGHAVRHRDGFAGWLDRVARTVASNLRRGEARQRAHVMASAADPRPDPPAPLPADEAAVLRTALAALPDRFRLPLELVYLDGLTHAEAALRLGQPKGTVDANVSRGLKRLRAALGPKAGVAIGVALPSAAHAVPPEWVEATVRAAAAVVPHPAGLAGTLAAWWATRPAAALAWTGVGTLIACAGIGAALSATPQPPPEPPPPAPAAPVPDQEPLTARNKRVLENDLLPRVVAALRPGVLNGGEVAVTRVEAHDFRVWCEFELRHKDAPAGVERTRLRAYLDTSTGRVAVQVDPWGRGDFRHLEPGRPIILLRVPEIKLDIHLRSEPLEQAVTVLRGFPPDPRVAGEADRYMARMRAALAPYQGVWRYRGDAGRREPFATDIPPRSGAAVQVPLRGVVEAGLLVVEPDGRVRHLFDAPPYYPYTLSPDRRRLTMPGTEHWWERE